MFQEQRAENGKLDTAVSFMSTAGAIIVPFAFVQYQMRQQQKDVDQMAKKLAATVQHVASIKVDEGRIETMLTHLRHVTAQLKEQKKQIDKLTSALRTQQRTLQDLVQQLEQQGFSYIPSKVNIVEVKHDEDEKSEDNEADNAAEEKPKKKRSKLPTLEDLGV